MPYPYQKEFEEQLNSLSVEELRDALDLMQPDQDYLTHIDARLYHVPPTATAVNVASTPYCATQARETQCMNFGFDGILNLYEPFSLVKLYISTRVPPAYYQDLVDCTKRAVNAWNLTFEDANDPRPRFAVVNHREEATSEVVYFGSVDGPFATSYFPGSPPRITVNALSFCEDHRMYLANFLVHELVHVQGARHYHAPREDIDLGFQFSEVIGAEDEFSVCAYTYPPLPPKIQPSDIKALRAAYSIVEDKFKTLKIVRHRAVLLHPKQSTEGPDPYQPRAISLCGVDDEWVVIDGGGGSQKNLWGGRFLWKYFPGK